MIKYLYYIILSLLLIACGNNDGDADAYGNFETTEIMVAAESSGKLFKSDIEEGKNMYAGQLAGIIDTIPFSIQLQQLYAQRKLLKTKYIQILAQKEVYITQKDNILREQKRMNELYKAGAATDKQLDDVNGQFKVTKKQIELVNAQYNAVNEEIESLEKQIELAEYQLKKCYIINPINGIILEIYTEPGEMVTTGKNIYKIANTKQLYLKAYISENKLTEFKLGDTVKVCVDKVNDKTTYPGVISWISASAEFTPKIVQTQEERVNLVYAFKVRVENDGYLKIGMPGEVKFE